MVGQEASGDRSRIGFPPQYQPLELRAGSQGGDVRHLVADQEQLGEFRQESKGHQIPDRSLRIARSLEAHPRELLECDPGGDCHILRKVRLVVGLEASFSQVGLPVPVLGIEIILHVVNQ